MPIPISEPVILRAGITTRWRRYWAGMPAPVWTLSYRILYPAAAAYDVPVAADGDGFVATIPSSAPLAAGQATLYGTATDGADVVSVYAARLEILPDLATADTLDPRSPAEIALADAEAALAEYLKSGGHISQWSIGGKTMQFRAADDILALVNHYRQIVARERIATSIAAGGAPGRLITRQY